MSSPELYERHIYALRFTDEELQQAREFWRPICRYLQRYVDPSGATLDLGAGYCHFINNIESREKIALDINGENLRRYANRDVRSIVSVASDLRDIESGSLSTAFASNVYEHLMSREDVAASCREVHRALRPGGRFIVLQPNFACCAKEYYDFFDHRLAFTHRAMAEGLAIAGFQLERVTAQFLPYTSKSRLPRAPWMVSLYLAIPIAWRILGGQMLLVGVKPATGARD
jgi:SAM-dependent methyltransferase